MMPSTGRAPSFDPDTAPNVGPVARWIYGVALPGFLVALGVYCLIVGRAWFIGRGGKLTVTGSAATGMAVAYIAVGGFINFYVFWATDQRWWRIARAGKIVSLCALIGGLGFAIVKVLLGSIVAL